MHNFLAFSSDHLAIFSHGNNSDNNSKVIMMIKSHIYASKIAQENEFAMCQNVFLYFRHFNVQSRSLQQLLKFKTDVSLFDFCWKIY